MLLTKEINVKLNKSNREHYKDKGYDVFQKEIIVKTHDLKDNSTLKVKIRCDYCDKTFERRWSDYVKTISNDFSKDACPECSAKRIAERKKVLGLQHNHDKNKLFKKKFYKDVKAIYEGYGCKLLLTEDEYENEYKKGHNLKKIIAPYICSCGRTQEGRSIHYFINKY